MQKFVSLTILMLVFIHHGTLKSIKFHFTLYRFLEYNHVVQIVLVHNKISLCPSNRCITNLNKTTKELEDLFV